MDLSQSTFENESRVDFVIVTALPEERDAVLSKLPGYKQLPPSEDDIRVYFLASLPITFPDNTTGIYRIIVMCLLGMGRVQAVTATTNAIQRWHPRYILLIGIAGGLTASNINIGDILIADQISDYESQKLTPDGCEVRWKGYQVDPRLLNSCNNIQNEEWKERIRCQYPGLGSPNLHIGTIVSGDKVIARDDILTEFKKTWPKLIGVEMEAAGVAIAAAQSPDKPGFFMIRSVSDLADRNKNSEDVQKWRSYACDVAASFVISFLMSGPITLIETLSGSVEIPINKPNQLHSEMSFGIVLDSEYLENYNSLIQQISLKRCCVFIGAGLSHEAHYPLYAELIQHLKSVVQQTTGNEIELDGYSTWDQVEILRTMMGEQSYREEVVNLFSPNGKLDYLPIHHEICTIPFLAYITTNLDYCLENAAKADNKRVTVQYYPDLDITRLRDGHIFHIHGVIEPSDPEKMIDTVVLSRRDYDRAYQSNTGLPRFLSSLAEYAIVFIGYSLGDIDLIRIIKTAKLELEQRGRIVLNAGLGTRRQPKYYIIMHKEATFDQDALDDLDILPICYGGDLLHHSGLQRLLESIHRRTTGIEYPEPILYRDMFEDYSHG